MKEEDRITGKATPRVKLVMPIGFFKSQRTCAVVETSEIEFTDVNISFFFPYLHKKLNNEWYFLKHEKKYNIFNTFISMKEWTTMIALRRMIY